MPSLIKAPQDTLLPDHPTPAIRRHSSDPADHNCQPDTAQYMPSLSSPRLC